MIFSILSIFFFFLLLSPLCSVSALDVREGSRSVNGGRLRARNDIRRQGPDGFDETRWPDAIRFPAIVITKILCKKKMKKTLPLDVHYRRRRVFERFRSSRFYRVDRNIIDNRSGGSRIIYTGMDMGVHYDSSDVTFIRIQWEIVRYYLHEYIVQGGIYPITTPAGRSAVVHYGDPMDTAMRTDSSVRCRNIISYYRDY